MGFTRATKKQSRLRLALMGPSGSGKTYTALAIASALSNGEPFAVLDTEHGSAAKYSDVFTFDTMCPPTFEPEVYAQAITDAHKAGYGVIVLDSLSHAWSGKGGALEAVDNAARRSSSGNSYTAWRDVTPRHNAMVDAIIQASIHVIVTMRVKTEYVIEKNQNGKSAPRKVGIQPVQRDGMEYEFDVVADIDLEHYLTVSKTRCSALDGKSFFKPGKDVADILLAWLSDGEKSEAAAPEPTFRPAQPEQAQTAESAEPCELKKPRYWLDKDVSDAIDGLSHDAITKLLVWANNTRATKGAFISEANRIKREEAA